MVVQRKVESSTKGSKTSTTTTAPKMLFDYNKALKEHGTKSAVIRSLAAKGLDTKTIYHTLVDAGVTNGDGTFPIRYQHVRNVLKMPVGKAANDNQREE